MIRVTTGRGGPSEVDERVNNRLRQTNLCHAPRQRPEIAVTCEAMRHIPAACLYLNAVRARRKGAEQRELEHKVAAALDALLPNFLAVYTHAQGERFAHIAQLYPSLDDDYPSPRGGLWPNKHAWPSPAIPPRFGVLQIYDRLGRNPPPLCQAAQGMPEEPIGAGPERRVDAYVESHLRC
jgi:hypothetical protein